MKLAVLFSGGKDSCLAGWIAKKSGYDISCLICVESENKESFMFHVPSVAMVSKQAEAMDIPLIIVRTKGEKEGELVDLKKGIGKAVRDFGIEGIVTGAVGSVYQTTRIQKICNELGIECFNPLWQKGQFEILEDLIQAPSFRKRGSLESENLDGRTVGASPMEEEKFDVIVVGVFAYPFDESWLGRKIDRRFVDEMKILNDKLKINPAGEGGEFESFVLGCPMFRKKLRIKNFKDFGRGNSWRREVEL